MIQSNLLGFPMAAKLFDGPRLEKEGTGQDSGETRIIALGANKHEKAEYICQIHSF